MINVEIEKAGTENAVSLLRRFSKRVQGAGLLSRMRSIRYSERKPSRYTKKKKALKKLARRKEVLELVKLGKLPDKTKGHRR